MSSIELSGRISPSTRIRRTAFWDSLQFILNGFIFVLLGEQLPNIFFEAVELVEQTGHHNPWWLIIYAVVICVVLTALRFVCVTTALFIMRLFARKRETVATQWRHVFVLSFAGVRGAVTLAGVMTLPLLLPDQSPFPARELAIFLAATVIIISLIIASIALPLLLKGTSPTPSHLQSYEQQTVFAIQTAYEEASKQMDSLITELDKQDLDHDYYIDLKNRILTEFANGFALHTDTDSILNKQHHAERLMRLKVVNSARATIYQLVKEKKISDELARELVHKLDLDEVRFK